MMTKFLSLVFLMIIFMNKIIWNLSFVWVMGLFLFSVKGLPVIFLTNNMSYEMSNDFMGFSLVMLSLWLFPLMLLASMNINFMSYYFNLFIFYLLSLLFFLFLTFSTLDFLLFYIYFESSLIPTFFLILGWGYQPERLRAGVYLLFYTLAGSLPLLMGLLYLQSFNCCSSFLIFSQSGPKCMSIFMFFGLLMAFLVKMPMYLVHLWLPKAHVEAPVAGSMILAGVLLKLGGYGLLRLGGLFFGLFHSATSGLISLSLIGGVVVSLICLRQSDLKMLVAYSSVAHMSLVIAGGLTGLVLGFKGVVILMVGHGLCSSGLFALVNMVYERSGSRSLVINRGWLNLLPSMSIWWFFFSAANMAAPPSLNLAGEIFLIITLVDWSVMNSVCLCLISFFSASYSLYLFSFSQHGSFCSGLMSLSGGYVREYLCLILHWVPLNLMILGGVMGFEL